MPRELGLHTFISPFYFLFSSSDIASHGGGKCDMKKKKKTNKKCSHLLRAQSHAQRKFFLLSAAHTKQSEKGNFVPFFRLFSESDRYAWKMYQNNMSIDSRVSFLHFFCLHFLMFYNQWNNLTQRVHFL